MQASERVRLVVDPDHPARPRVHQSRAWLLDADAFHDEFELLYREADTAEGIARMRWMATQLWRSADEAIHRYVDLLPTSSADDWEADYDPSHLGEWYRVLMAAHLEPAPSLSDPRALRDGLTALGWTPTEARRLAYGRELTTLVASFASDVVVSDIAPQLMVGCRGWLDDEDVELGLDRLHALDPAAFRHQQPLVPLVEELHAMLLAERASADRVLLLLDG
ncbi:MAG TPA: hypothetical protein VMT43_06170 [Acidimicrobiales bacterium]|nr:hypothetical protein [Acidimicrobiales bacterium]